MNKKEIRLKEIIKFVDACAVTTVDRICERFGISTATFYRTMGKRLVSSINENGRYITTSARVKRCRDRGRSTSSTFGDLSFILIYHRSTNR